MTTSFYTLKTEFAHMNKLEEFYLPHKMVCIMKFSYYVARNGHLRSMEQAGQSMPKGM